MNDLSNLYPARETWGSSPKGVFSGVLSGYVCTVRTVHAVGKDEDNYYTFCELTTWRVLAQVIAVFFCCILQCALHSLHSPYSHNCMVQTRWVHNRCPCVYCVSASQVFFSAWVLVQSPTTANKQIFIYPYFKSQHCGGPWTLNSGTHLTSNL